MSSTLHTFTESWYNYDPATFDYGLITDKTYDRHMVIKALRDSDALLFSHLLPYIPEDDEALSLMIGRSLNTTCIRLLLSGPNCDAQNRTVLRGILTKLTEYDCTHDRLEALITAVDVCDHLDHCPQKWSAKLFHLLAEWREYAGRYGRYPVIPKFISDTILRLVSNIDRLYSTDILDDMINGLSYLASSSLTDGLLRQIYADNHMVWVNIGHEGRQRVFDFAQSGHPGDYMHVALGLNSMGMSTVGLNCRAKVAAVTPELRLRYGITNNTDVEPFLYTNKFEDALRRSNAFEKGGTTTTSAPTSKSPSATTTSRKAESFAEFVQKVGPIHMYGVRNDAAGIFTMYINGSPIRIDLKSLDDAANVFAQSGNTVTPTLNTAASLPLPTSSLPKPSSPRNDSGPNIANLVRQALASNVERDDGTESEESEENQEPDTVSKLIETCADALNNIDDSNISGLLKCVFSSLNA